MRKFSRANKATVAWWWRQ